MQTNGMTGAVSLVGFGLCGIAAAMLMQTVGSTADAAPAAGEAFGPGEPTIVWMGVSTVGSSTEAFHTYHRLWSDGRLELRRVRTSGGFGTCWFFGPPDCDWQEVPPPPAGDGFACRADTNGDRQIDGVDLAAVLGDWGANVSCDPQPTYPCFDLGGLQLPQ